MSFVIAASAVISAGLGVHKAVQGKNAADEAKIEADKARKEMEKHKEVFAALDTSNPYSNTMEDLKVNTQEAEFSKQQSMQSQANIMQQMRGAAGGSGIAALAQTLANEGSLQAQKSSASIGTQEAANQTLQAQDEQRVQSGEVMSRNMKFGKVQSQMAMSAGDVQNANAAQAAGQQQMMAGIGDAVTGTASFFGAMDGNWGGNKTLNAEITAEEQAANLAQEKLNEETVNDEGYNTNPEGNSYYSDRRLKKNIKHIGLSPSGLKIYSFKYIDPSLGEGTWQGVMSDEIPSIHVRKQGIYDAVNYSALDVEFKQL